MMCIFRSTKLWSVHLYRHFRTNKCAAQKQASNTILDSLNNAQNSIIISQSHDIFENLAFEDWFYKNCDMASSDMSILLIWYNGPSVVIGRFQNPWIECSVDFCEANGISIARRNSGGGTVYHDFGNLNFSFLTSPKNYNRKRNLEFLCESIRRRWHINLSVSKRDDILYNEQYKISGTASKLGRTNTYHHCTILVKVDELKLRKALHRELKGVKSRATSSTRAKVINLNSVCADIDTLNVMKAVTDHYKQINKLEDKSVFCPHPNELICPGMDSMKENLQTWKWRFGHTPDFEVTRSFLMSSPNINIRENHPSIEIVLSVKKGVIENLSLNPPILEKDCFDALHHFIINSPFSVLIYVPLEKWLGLSKDKTLCGFIKSCIVQMVIDVFR